MTNQRRSRTRNQRRREAITTAATVASMVVLLVVLSVLFLKVWTAHPGEQPISGQTYFASIQNGGDEW